jgi:hypothetical protein
MRAVPSTFEKGLSHLEASRKARPGSVEPVQGDVHFPCVQVQVAAQRAADYCARRPAVPRPPGARGPGPIAGCWPPLLTARVCCTPRAALSMSGPQVAMPGAGDAQCAWRKCSVAVISNKAGPCGSVAGETPQNTAKHRGHGTSQVSAAAQAATTRCGLGGNDEN